LAPYALVGDGTYPPQPFMFSPFEGQKYGYSREKYNCNFIQNNTKMCVEKSFGLLKGHVFIKSFGLLKNMYLINLGLYPTWWMV
jgi:hypothetical protein